MNLAVPTTTLKTSATTDYGSALNTRLAISLLVARAVLRQEFSRRCGQGVENGLAAPVPGADAATVAVPPRGPSMTIQRILARLHTMAPNSLVSWSSTRTAIGCATSVAPRASSSRWPSSSAQAFEAADLRPTERSDRRSARGSSCGRSVWRRAAPHGYSNRPSKTMSFLPAIRHHRRVRKPDGTLGGPRRRQ
jgi:hypothetical protein